MKFVILPFAALSIILMINFNPDNVSKQKESEDLGISVNISNSFINRLSRLINVKHTVFYIELHNKTEEMVVLQKPISNWNLFLTINDTDNKEIHSHLVVHFQPIIDSSDYISLSPNASTIYKCRVNYFGAFRIGFNKISKFNFRYIPQKHPFNKNYYNLMEENYLFEYQLK